MNERPFTNETVITDQFMSGGGEMGELMRAKDWSKTSLGPVEMWPQSLRTSVSLCLSSTFPILIAWGPETIQIYNDSYIPICGAKHPEALGQNFRICWETALPVVGDAFTRGQQGEGTYIKDQRMYLDRYGYLEDSFMTFSFAPIRDESGEVGGIFHPITETTEKMLSARRTQVLRNVATQVGLAKTNEEIFTLIAKKYEGFIDDLPFMLLYKLNEDASQASLIDSIGLSDLHVLKQPLINISDIADGWPIYKALSSGKIETVTALDAIFGAFECAPFPEAPHTAAILPVNIAGKEQPFGFVVAGVSARRALDQEYFNFYELLGNTISTAFSNVHAYEEEQKRAEALAAIDKAKTAFFSNVSHEFRTPLTLMLGPLEELVEDKGIQQQPKYKSHVEATYRNAMRLLKLVNNLLDFSRTEAGRVKAIYRPLDLSALTADLSSSFRSIVEKAGLQLVVDTPSFTRLYYADSDMWEKIVLNLISNAFKYTLQGSITVSVQEVGDNAILKVTDTGVGIPAHELPFMFERFHRVENSGGRTHEGTGIGLSLVSELVRLHRGTIAVNSIEGSGSTFTVSIPKGSSHLPEAQIAGPLNSSSKQSALATSFLKEASSLLDAALPDAILEERITGDEERLDEDKETKILIVDDNADMRQYLRNLLEPYFTVQVANNGADALNKIFEHQPQLILSDIMMPVMDGKELLERLKKNTATASIPLIFLSARAGEEARIDGLEAGADDYLVKPFSAKELLTKIKAQVKIARTRRYAEAQLRRLLHHAPVAIAIYHGSNFVVEGANAIMLQYWGRHENEVIGRPLLDAIPELEAQGFSSLMRKVYETGARFVSDDVPITLKRFGNEELLFVKVTMEALRDEQGNVYGIIAIANEITDLVEARRLAQQNASDLEKRVEERASELVQLNKELLHTNQELERFAYVSSHDLQEPLRKIQTFSDLILRRDAIADEQTKKYLQKVIASSERMSALIKDLLNFSKTRDNTGIRTATDLNAILKDVLSDYEALISEKQAVVHTEVLPQIHAIPVQMNQLLYNLVGNALKFSKERPVIHITATVVAGVNLHDRLPQGGSDRCLRLRVADNGIGFNPSYTEQMFTIFKRLHSNEVYEGTGIGLALCRKVAENHGGFIEATGKEGEGAMFDVYMSYGI